MSDKYNFKVGEWYSITKFEIHPLHLEVIEHFFLRYSHYDNEDNCYCFKDKNNNNLYLDDEDLSNYEIK